MAAHTRYLRRFIAVRPLPRASIHWRVPEASQHIHSHTDTKDFDALKELKERARKLEHKPLKELLEERARTLEHNLARLQQSMKLSEAKLDTTKAMLQDDISQVRKNYGAQNIELQKFTDHKITNFEERMHANLESLQNDIHQIRRDIESLSKSFDGEFASRQITLDAKLTPLREDIIQIRKENDGRLTLLEDSMNQLRASNDNDRAFTKGCINQLRGSIDNNRVSLDKHISDLRVSVENSRREFHGLFMHLGRELHQLRESMDQLRE